MSISPARLSVQASLAGHRNPPGGTPMSDITTPSAEPASPQLVWDEVSDGEAFAIWIGGGFATVGRQIDGQWLPFVLPAGEVALQIGPAASRQAAQHWAEKALG